MTTTDTIPPLLAIGAGAAPAGSPHVKPAPTTCGGAGNSGKALFFVWLALSGLLLAGLIWAVVAITGFFRLSSDVASLRRAFMKAVPGKWEKTVALRVGAGTTGLVKFGGQFFELPAEPRAALAALKGAEAGVYKLDHDPSRGEYGSVFAAADKAMISRGWERIVGVSEKNGVVAVYLPQRRLSESGIKCCVLVFQGRDLVVASVTGDLRPLLALAEKELNLAALRQQWHAGIKL